MSGYIPEDSEIASWTIKDLHLATIELAISWW